MSDGEKIAEAVLPMLQEYTLRLRSDCTEYLKSRPSSLGFRLWGGAVVLANAGMVLGMVLYGIPPKGVPLPVFLASICLSIANCVIGLQIVSLRRQTNILRHHAIRTTARRLERLVRVGSPVEDHDVEDYATRIQLQVRLADAEAALELVEAVLGKDAWDKARDKTLAEVRNAEVKARGKREDSPDEITAAASELLRERHP